MFVVNKAQQPEQQLQPTQVQVREGDVSSARDQAAVIELLNLYASQLAGRMQPLSEAVVESVLERLPMQSNCRLFLAEADERIVGMALCFVGFSTFKGASLINIHDLAVHPDFQRRGIGSQLLNAVTDYARQQQFCAVTLEVHGDNPARQLYARHGFQVLDVPVDERVMLFGKLEIV